MCPNLYLADHLGSPGRTGHNGLPGLPGQKGSPGPKGDTGIGLPGIVGVLRTNAHKSDIWPYAIYLWANYFFRATRTTGTKWKSRIARYYKNKHINR